MATAPSTQPISEVTTSTDQSTTTTPTVAQTINTVIQSEETPTTTAANSLSATSTRMCLLKTAIANVSAGKTTVEAHILFDEDAQCYFITQELANQLQIHPVSHEQISVSSFGEQVSATKGLAVASISIETVNKGHIPLSILIVPKLAAPICNSVRTHLDQLPHLKGLPLAHPVTNDENFHISILIGADFYWQFIQDRIVRGEELTAVESRLGYLLSGPLPFPQSMYITCSLVLTFSCITEEVHCPAEWLTNIS